MHVQAKPSRGWARRAGLFAAWSGEVHRDLTALFVVGYGTGTNGLSRLSSSTSDRRVCVQGELVVDDLLCDVGELAVVVACVGADAVECGGHVDMAAFGHHAFGLLDGDSAVQRMLELSIANERFSGRLRLENRDAGNVGECLRERDVSVG